MLTSRGLGTVLGDLASLGFDAEWGVLGADNAKLPHRRKRIWIVATNSNCKYVERRIEKKILQKRGLQRIDNDGVDKNQLGLRSLFASGLCRKFNGIPGQVDRLKAVGNAQVPIVAAMAWQILTKNE
jgi:DNA (cytosine-5)-methyltransferase 1